jgi:hypothetical protein
MEPRLSWETPASRTQQEQAGLRFGSRGTHTSRTLMLADLSELLDLVLRAKQLGLVRARIGGGVTEIDPRGLDPLAGWE